MTAKLLMILAAYGLAACTVPDSYRSPDGAGSITVTSSAHDGCNDSLQFKRSGKLVTVNANPRRKEDELVGRVLRTEASSSCLNKATWSPDSQFFVFSLFSPTEALSTTIYYLHRDSEDVQYLNSGGFDPKFELTAPDVVHLTASQLSPGRKPWTWARSLGEDYWGRVTGPEWRPEAAIAQHMESLIRMPPDAHPIADYTRYYMGSHRRDGHRVVYALFSHDGDRQMHLGEHGNSGYDGGCRWVHVLYDLEVGKILGVACNGVA